MKDKDGAISGRQLNNRFVQREPIKYWEARHNVEGFDYLLRQFAVFGKLLFSAAIFAKVHQHVVNRQAVQPRRKSAFTTKGIQLAKYLNEDLLGQIFRFRSISSHSQTYGIHLSVMKLEEFLERQQITSYRFFRL